MTVDLNIPAGLQIGDWPTLTFTFTDANGDASAVDRDDVTVTVTNDAGATAYTGTGQLTDGGTGIVTLKITLTSAGIHYAKCAWSNDPDGAAVTAKFNVDPDPTV